MEICKDLRPGPAGQVVILVAEDEEIVQNMVKLTLERDGYCVLTAGDGLEALEVVRRFPGTIHLLLTDVLMPRMDGLELARLMRMERPATPVLVMSGTHYPGQELRYLGKPFSPARLRAAVAGMLSDGP